MLNLPRENDVIAGKYRVERIIGRGGMGIVVAAWHLELDQRVALKFLMPELVERGESAERFRREARAAARIKSEHVVRVLDVGNWEGNAPYMVMEYLDGRDLSAELRERGQLTTKECVDYVLQAIEAVAEAHSLGIVHRDLKPENLFLARRADGSRSVKVLDFGISKTLMLGSSDEPSLTRTANIMGSPFYMSPEQMRTPRNVDARSDIWAIGAILYDLLAGRPPYVAETIPQLCTMLLENDPDPIRNTRPDVTEDLEHVVMRCLAKRVEDRWSSVGELAVALAPFASRSSRVHVERAGRVLGGSGSMTAPPESSLQSSAPPPPLQGRAGTGPGLRNVTPTQASMDSPVLPPDSSTTHDSWGRTQRHMEQAQKRPAGSPPSWQWFIIGGAVLLSVVVAIIALRGSSASHAEASGEGAPVLAPKDPPLARPDPASAAKGVTAEALPAADPPVADPGAAPSSNSSANPAASTEPKPGTMADLAKRPTVRMPAPPPPQAPRPKPTASSGLTDFGGRR
jgi:serine/threonine-protein kinase